MPSPKVQAVAKQAWAHVVKVVLVLCLFEGLVLLIPVVVPWLIAASIVTAGALLLTGLAEVLNRADWRNQ